MSNNVKRVKYNDFRNGSPKELMKFYKLNDRQLEQAIRRNNEGANKKDLEKVYSDIYDKK